MLRLLARGIAQKLFNEPDEMSDGEKNLREGGIQQSDLTAPRRDHVE
jgi:hypothetical protein